MGIVIIVLLYAFLGVFTARVMIKMDIGVTHYSSGLFSDDYYGPFFGGLFWPAIWLFYGLKYISDKLINRVWPNE